MVISTKEVLHICPSEVRANPYQPRRIFDTEGLNELASSIKTYGVLQPISVRRIGNIGYELVAGERRLRASRIAGLTSIPAILVEIADIDSAIIAIIENLQRRDLHFFEEAEGYSNLMHDYSFTQEELAARVGKNQSTIANKLRLLKLSRTVQRLVVENQLSERHARALLRIESEVERAELLSKIIEDKLNVRKAEEMIDSIMEQRKQNVQKNRPKVHSNIPFKAYIKDIRILTNSIKQDLEVMESAGMGTQFEIMETDTGYNIQIILNCTNSAIRESTSA